MIEKFITDTFERDVKSFITAKELHKMYLEYAKKNGLEELTQNQLTRRLNNKRIGAARYKWINGKSVSLRYGLKVKE